MQLLLFFLFIHIFVCLYEGKELFLDTTFQEHWMSTSLSKHSFLCTIIFVFAFSARVQASRIDTQVTSLMFNIMGEGPATTFLPGIGVGYDFRTPADRSGWSLASTLVMGSVIYNDDPSDYSHITSFIFPNVIGKYRYAFNKQLSMDLNLGGGLVVTYFTYLGRAFENENNLGRSRSIIKISRRSLLAPFLSVGFHYSFTNQIMLGMSAIAFYGGNGLAPIVALSLSFPIADHHAKGWSRRRR